MRPRQSAATRCRALRRLARKCVWWKPPAETLRDTRVFVAHVMTFGDWDGAISLRRLFTEDELRAALRAAPAGVLDARSWHYWHYVRGIWDVPPRPVRTLRGAPPGVPTSKLDWARELRTAGPT